MSPTTPVTGDVTETVIVPVVYPNRHEKLFEAGTLYKPIVRGLCWRLRLGPVIGPPAKNESILGHILSVTFHIYRDSLHVEDMAVLEKAI